MDNKMKAHLKNHASSELICVFRVGMTGCAVEE